MFAIRKNGTDFNGRSLRVFPSSENPRKGILSKMSHIKGGIFFNDAQNKNRPSSAK